MGMDIYGVNPVRKEGEYFRANVWFWHPLADYLVAIAPELMKKVEYLHYNDGDGLDGPDSVALADVLDAELASGKTQEYIDNRAAELAAMPDEVCEFCEGEGVRWVQGECNPCKGTGKMRPWATHYHMALDVVQEFATFVRHSNGFEIR